MDLDPLPATSPFFGLITATINFGLGETIAIVLALLCLLISGFISGSEISLFSLTQNQREEFEDSPKGHIINSLLNVPEKLLATILIANNLVNVTIVVLCNFALGPVFENMPEVLSFILQTILLTFLILLFGEILPKLYAKNNNVKWANFACSSLLFIVKLFSPISSMLVKSTSIVNKVVTKKTHDLSTDELSKALEITDVDESNDKDMLEGILKFGDTTASEIMTPRVDITDLNINSTFDEVMDIVISSGYSRLPVYSETQDNIKGILYSRDLLPYIGKKTDNFQWQILLRKPYFVPESRMIDDILEDFRKQKNHIAIVVDEFGGTQGLVTLEDVLEEIVGDIDDEYDNEEKTYKRLSDNTFIFDGKTPLTDFFRITELNDDEFSDATDDAETLAGMLLAIKGDFPRAKETLSYKNCSFTILNITNHRITSIQVKINTESSQA